MKRYSLGLVLLMVLVLGSAAFAVFPTPDGTATFTVKQGFGPQGQTIWFFCTDTSDINFASTMQFPYRPPTLAAPLTSLCNSGIPPTSGTGAAYMYINTCDGQGPIFSAMPWQVRYSGFWTVVFINWLPGQCRKVCNLQPFNAVTNPFGFPIITPGPTQQATLSEAYGTTRSCAVLDCPIVAVGAFPVSGPWAASGSGVPPAVNYTFYRLPQVVAYNAYNKTVTLPTYNVYCQEFIARYIDKCSVIIPDVSDRTLAIRLKANWAPGQLALDEDNAQDFYVITGRVFGVTPPPTFAAGGPAGPFRAVNQYPIIEACPSGIGAQNQNRDYTPFMEVDLLDLTTAPDPANLALCFVNNANFADMLEDAGFFTQTDDGFINAPVVDCFRILPPTGACCLPCP